MKNKMINKQLVIDVLRDYFKKYGYTANEIHLVQPEETKQLKKIQERYVMGQMVVYSETKLMPTIVLDKKYVFLLVGSEELPHANIFIFDIYLNK